MLPARPSLIAHPDLPWDGGGAAFLVPQMSLDALQQNYQRKLRIAYINRNER